MHNKTDEVRAFCSKNRQSHKRNLESLGLVILVAMHRRLVTINNAALAAAASTAIMSIDELSRIAMERCAWLAMGKGPFPLGRMAGLDEGNQLSRGGGGGGQAQPCWLSIIFSVSEEKDEMDKDIPACFDVAVFPRCRMLSMFPDKP